MAVWTDPIVEEVHQWRREILATFDNDLGKYVAHLMESQKRHGDRLVSRPSIGVEELRARIREAYPAVYEELHREKS